MGRFARGAIALATVLFAAAAWGEGPDPRLERARSLSWNGAYAESIALYRELLAERGDEPGLRRELGEVLLWAGREAEAAQEFEAVLRARPDDPRVRAELAKALAWAGRANEAVLHYRRLYPGLLDDPELTADAVRALRWAGRREEAQRWLMAAFERHPRAAALRVVDASGKLDAGRLDEAERELRAVLAEHPDRADAKEELEALEAMRSDPVRRAKRLAGAGHTARAVAVLEERLRAHPDDLEARRWLARYRSWEGSLEAAERDYRRVLTARPADVGLRSELAEVLSWEGRYAEAASLARGLLAEDPSALDPQLVLLDVDLWTGDLRGAAQRLARLERERPDAPGLAERRANYRELRAPALEAPVSFFRDTDGLRVVDSTLRASYSPQPGRRLELGLTNLRASGRRRESSAPGAVRLVDDSDRALGLSLRWQERPDFPWGWAVEVGALRWSRAGTSPELRFEGTWRPNYEHELTARLRHGSALRDVLSYESVPEGIERSALELEHSFSSRRVALWSEVAAGHYSDGPRFVSAESVLGFRVPRVRPLEFTLHATWSRFSRSSSHYYSPRDLLAGAVGLRFRWQPSDRLELRGLAEVGTVRTSEGDGESLHWAPGLHWQIGRRLALELYYDHYDSIRSGSYRADLAGVVLRARFP